VRVFPRAEVETENTASRGDEQVANNPQSAQSGDTQSGDTGNPGQSGGNPGTQYWFLMKWAKKPAKPVICPPIPPVILCDLEHRGEAVVGAMRAGPCRGGRVRGSGFRVRGSGFGVQGSGFRRREAGEWVFDPSNVARWLRDRGAGHGVHRLLWGGLEIRPTSWRTVVVGSIALWKRSFRPGRAEAGLRHEGETGLMPFSQ
jgi:hypothetical protein